MCMVFAKKNEIKFPSLNYTQTKDFAFISEIADKWHSNVLSLKCNVLFVLVASRVQHFETPWTVARQAPLSVEFFRREY